MGKSDPFWVAPIQAQLGWPPMTKFYTAHTITCEGNATGRCKPGRAVPHPEAFGPYLAKKFLSCAGTGRPRHESSEGLINDWRAM